MEKELYLRNIPMLISYQCLLFSKDPEYFINDSRTNSFKHIHFTNNCSTISSDGMSPTLSGGSAFCHQQINCGANYVATWILKITKCHRNNRGKSVGIRIGLYAQRFYQSLAIKCTGRISKDPRKYGFAPRQYTLPFHEGDIVGIIVDLNKKQIRYKVNENIQIVAEVPRCDVEHPAKYNLSVSLNTCYESSVSIVDFYIDR